MLPSEPFSSRRAAANAAHANGAAPGTPSPAPPDNHANNPAPNEPTTPVAAAGAADITGAAAAAAAATGTDAAPAAPETTDIGALTVTDAAGTAAAAAARAGESLPTANTGAEPTATSPRPPPARTGVADAAGTPPSEPDSAPPDRPPEPPTGTTGTTGAAEPRPDSAPALSAEDEERPRDEVTAGESAPSGTEDGADAGELTPPRAPVRDPRPEPTDEASEDPDDEEPVDPSEPCRSANATGIDTTAAPTPRATANAPTRPTYRAHTDPDGSGITRRNSIGRTSRRPPWSSTRSTDDDKSADMSPSRAFEGVSPRQSRMRRDANRNRARSK